MPGGGRQQAGPTVPVNSASVACRSMSAGVRGSRADTAAASVMYADRGVAVTGCCARCGDHRSQNTHQKQTYQARTVTFVSDRRGMKDGE